MQLLANGLTLEEVAKTLKISVNTVKAHLNRTFFVINVRNRCELIAWGFRNGVLR